MSYSGFTTGSSVRFEPPDIAVWKFVGDVSEQEVRGLIAELEPQVAGTEYLLMLTDLTEVGVFSAGARKATSVKTPYDVRATAVFGATAHMRIVANLMITASNLLTRRPDNPGRFFATEAEARAWLEERRQFMQRERAARAKR